MIGINSYKDLCREIEILELRAESIESEIKQLRKIMLQGPKDITGIDYSREPGGSIVHMPLDRLIDRLDRLEKTISTLKDTLEQKKRYKGKIENVLKKFDGVNHKVMYLRIVEGKKQREIADILGYDERHIRRIIKQCRENLSC